MGARFSMAYWELPWKQAIHHGILVTFFNDLIHYTVFAAEK
jgi:hypothetical protein